MLEAIFALKPGEVSAVIQTPFGFELFKVEERKAGKLDELRREVDALIRQHRYEALYQEMRGRNGVKVDEGYFKAPGGVGPPCSQAVASDLIPPSGSDEVTFW